MPAIEGSKWTATGGGMKSSGIVYEGDFISMDEFLAMTGYFSWDEFIKAGKTPIDAGSVATDAGGAGDRIFAGGKWLTMDEFSTTTGFGSYDQLTSALGENTRGQTVDNPFIKGAIVGDQVWDGYQFIDISRFDSVTSGAVPVNGWSASQRKLATLAEIAGISGGKPPESQTYEDLVRRNHEASPDYLFEKTLGLEPGTAGEYMAQKQAEYAEMVSQGLAAPYEEAIKAQSSTPNAGLPALTPEQAELIARRESERNAVGDDYQRQLPVEPTEEPIYQLFNFTESGANVIQEPETSSDEIRSAMVNQSTARAMAGQNITDIYQKYLPENING